LLSLAAGHDVGQPQYDLRKDGEDGGSEAEQQEEGNQVAPGQLKRRGAGVRKRAGGVGVEAADAQVLDRRGGFEGLRDQTPAGALGAVQSAFWFNPASDSS
jgi:hypothetical protein